MKPEEYQSTGRFSPPRAPQRDSSSYQQPTRPSTSGNHNRAAANIVRGKIENIYDQTDRAAATTSTETPPTNNTESQSPEQTSYNIAQRDLEIQNPYHRSRTSTPQPQADYWNKYHTAWQNYYQKYYERYYVNKVYEATEQQRSSTPNEAEAKTTLEASTSQPSDSIKSNDALYELRRNLREKISTSAKKVRKSHHFMPIAAALVVVVIFAFLQYNRVLISNVTAYISPGAIDPQNLVIDPTASVEVSDEPQLIIPKINVDVPVVYGVGPDNTSQMAAMEEGVAHFAIPGANSTPGQVGNTVISGHSSNDLFEAGDYKFIFAQLDKLSDGDMIYANYEGTRYSYSVTKKEVVMPTDVQALIYDTDTPVLTLITCTPLGTAEKRLLVTAEQVSPDPAQARESSDSDDDSAGAAMMPSNAPTLTQRIFGR